MTSVGSHRRRRRTGSNMPAVPARGREHDGAGIVLPHPAGEVAARPRREARGADRGARAERRRAARAAAARRTAGRRRARGRRRRGTRGHDVARVGAGRDRRAPRARRSRAPARCPRRSSGRRRSAASPDEQHAAVRRAGAGRSAAGSATRARCSSGSASRSEDVAQRSVASSELAPQRLERLARSRRRRRAARRSRRWRRRRRAGTPTRTRGGGRARTAPRAAVVDAGEVLAEPRASSPRSRGASGSSSAAHGRPVAVGGDDHVPRAQRRCRRRASRSTVVARRRRRFGRRRRRRARRRLASRERDQRGVELGAGHDAGVRAVGAAAGARPRGRSARRARSRGPPRTTAACATSKPERLEQAQRAGGEAVAAGLVAREAWPCRRTSTSSPRRRAVIPAAIAGRARPRPRATSTSGSGRRSVDGTHVSPRPAPIAARIGPSTACRRTNRRLPGAPIDAPTHGASRMNVVVCVKQIPDPAVPGELDGRPHAQA